MTVKDVVMSALHHFPQSSYKTQFVSNLVAGMYNLSAQSACRVVITTLTTKNAEERPVYVRIVFGGGSKNSQQPGFNRLDIQALNYMENPNNLSKIGRASCRESVEM